jgi:hypothetical protein
MAASAKIVADRYSRTSSSTNISHSSSTISFLVRAMMPLLTPSNSMISICSLVCAITPSSAAITSITRSMPKAPASICRINRSCPGTSTMAAFCPSGSTKGANPNSMEIPLCFSSLSRSVSIPVRAFTSVVFP